MFTSIAGKSVIVTGASKGIGKGIAEVFARAGAKVLIVSRSEEAAQKTADDIVKTGGIASAIAGDVTRESDMELVANTAVERHGGLDILCANAGIYPQTKLESMSVTEWNEVIGTNLTGNFLSVKACLSHMKGSDNGRIILTSSITGPVTGFPGWTHYGATKWVNSDLCVPRVWSSQIMALQLMRSCLGIR